MKKEKLVRVVRKDGDNSRVVVELERKGHLGEKRVLSKTVKFEDFVSEPVSEEVADALLNFLGDRAEIEKEPEVKDSAVVNE